MEKKEIIIKETKVFEDLERIEETLQITKIKGDYKYQYFSRGEKIESQIIKGDFIKDIAFDVYEKTMSIGLRFDFVGGVDWDGLAEHYGVQLADAPIGYNVAAAEVPNPTLRDHRYYAQLEEHNKYIEINELGEHRLVSANDHCINPIFP